MSCSMMFKKISGFLVLLFVILFPMQVRAKDDASFQNILILYSEEADPEVKDASLELAGMLAWKNCPVTLLPLKEGEEKTDDYEYVIFFQAEQLSGEFCKKIEKAQRDENKKFCFVGNKALKQYMDETGGSRLYEENRADAGKLVYEIYPGKEEETLVHLEDFVLLKGKADYQCGSVVTIPEENYFCKRIGNLTHISVSDWSSKTVKWAIFQEILHFKGTEEKAVPYEQYLVLDKVYPFCDQEKLMETIQLFEKEKLPFVISVMPVYRNEDYPGMKHFCEILRYAQDRGGAVILHSPVNHMSQFDAATGKDAIKKAMENYEKYGVHPLAIQVPSNWILCEEARKAIEGFDVVFISDEKDDRIKTKNIVNTDAICQDQHRFITSTVYLDMGKSQEDLKNQIADCRSSLLPVKNLWDIGGFSQDILKDKEYVPFEYEENYDYRRNIGDKISKDLSEENHKLLIAVMIVSVLFVIFIAVARKNNKKKFFYEDREEETVEKGKDKE